MSKVYQHFQQKRIVRRYHILEYFSGNVERTNQAIQWMLKSGKAQSIKTGVYYLKRPDEWFEEEVSVSSWLIAGKAFPGSAVAYHSALRLLGYGYSESNRFQSAVGLEFSRAPKPFKYQESAYHFFRTDLSFGVDSVEVEGVNVSVFSKERILLEGLMKPDLFMGMAEFIKSIEGFEWIDLKALMEMINYYPLPTISMRLGWVLEKFQEKWYISEEVLKTLKDHQPKYPLFFVARNRDRNFFVPKWNLLVPKTLIDLEVHYVPME